jgi:phage-related protein
MTGDEQEPKPVVWIGSSLKDLKAFPDEVKDEVGFALFEAQCGRQPSSAKPLKGFHGASVLEIKDDFQTDTYRLVYTVKFEGVIYVLHAFQKKSKRGIATSQADIDLIKERLKVAKKHHEQRKEAPDGQEQR